MALVSISAHDIDAAGLAVEAELPLVWLKEELADADLQGAAPGRVRARLSRSGGDVVVRGQVTADLRTPCARCLEPARVAVDTELSLLLQPAPSGAHHSPAHAHASHSSHQANGNGKADAKDEEYEFTSAEADVDTYDGETVVLDPFIREAILLEVPNFPLCSEDCPGIRPASAEPAPEPAPRVDPRLAPLGALRDKLAAAPEKKMRTATVRERTKKKDKE